MRLLEMRDHEIISQYINYWQTEPQTDLMGTAHRS